MSRNETVGLDSYIGFCHTSHKQLVSLYKETNSPQLRIISHPLAHTAIMKNAYQVKQISKNFCKCGIAGWCLEVVFTSMESLIMRDWRLMGKTSLLMFPIYGLGVLLSPIGQAVDKWLRVEPGEVLTVKDRILRHGILYMVLIFAAEYLFGAWLRARGICPWDYSGRHSNVNGLIRLDFAPLWFLTGLLFEQITKKKGA